MLPLQVAKILLLKPQATSATLQTLERKTSGKWYVEFTINQISSIVNNTFAGIVSSTVISNLIGGFSLGQFIYEAGGNIIDTSTTVVTTSSFTTGDTIGIAVSYC